MIIEVTDINDNAPFFPAENQETIIYDDFLVGDTIDYVVATDWDAPGINSDVEYRFSVQDKSQKILSYINLDKLTGEVSLVKSLTPELVNEYAITIYAQDKAKTPLSASLQWKLKIKPANRFAPEIHFVSYQNPNDCHIPENGGTDYLVGHFDITDSDVGFAGQTEIELLDNFDLFTIADENEQFLLKSLVSFDYERQKSYVITVQAKDCGDDASCKPFLTEEKIQLLICDENDNYPIFEREVYRQYIDENEYSGSLFLLNAADADSGANGEIEYDLEGNYAKEYFLITGSYVGMTKRFDAEQFPEFLELKAVAKDKGYIKSVHILLEQLFCSLC